ncbi:hypothetical protein ACFQZI_11440 [Mucilaginibacter lutimaris]|uniref:Uncharacterized protein n=1 Tax=Mucilaginibacter lutimaris TaxID=931629 RepID=A0ABW2ZH12_9SPHI
MPDQSPNEQFALEMAAIFNDAQIKLNAYLTKNEPELREQGLYDDLDRLLGKLLDVYDQYAAQAAGILYDGSEAIFEGLKDATKEVKAAVKQIDDISKTIAIVAGVVSLGLAVLSADTGGIKDSIEGIIKAAAKKSDD